jgi:DNA-binding NtrC family response regulator
MDARRSAMAHVRVLLVDDEKDFVAVLKERLEMRGLDVVAAGDGQNAIEAVRKRSFDVIILDLQMPGMDGIETLKQIMKLDQKAQVILLTGHATPKKSAEAIQHGAANFLEKPADLQDLLGKIGEAAAKRMELVQEHFMQKIEDIIKSRGW